MKKSLFFAFLCLLVFSLLCACAKTEDTHTVADDQTPFEIISSELRRLTGGKQDYVLELQYDTASSEDGKVFENDISLRSRTVMNKSGSLSVEGTLTQDGDSSGLRATMADTVLYVDMDSEKLKADFSSPYMSDEAEEISEMLASFTGSFSMFEIEKDWLGARSFETQDGSYTVTLTFTQDEIDSYQSAILELLGNTYEENNLTLSSVEYRFVFDSDYRLTELSLRAEIRTQSNLYKTVSYALSVSYPDPIPTVTAPADADDYNDIGTEYDFDEN